MPEFKVTNLFIFLYWRLMTIYDSALQTALQIDGSYSGKVHYHLTHMDLLEAKFTLY